MLASRNVTSGKYYVNRARDIAREVVEIRDDLVIFTTYHLNTGKSSGTPSMCMRHHFAHWADHEATLNEMSNIQHQRMYTM